MQSRLDIRFGQKAVDVPNSRMQIAENFQSPVRKLGDGNVGDLLVQSTNEGIQVLAQCLDVGFVQVRHE